MELLKHIIFLDIGNILQLKHSLGAWLFVVFLQFEISMIRVFYLKFHYLGITVCLLRLVVGFGVFKDCYVLESLLLSF